MYNEQPRGTCTNKDLLDTVRLGESSTLGVHAHEAYTT